MKSGDDQKRSTLRLMLAAIKERDIAVRSDGNYDGINDTDIVALLQKMIKQRLQSIDLYNQGNREDLAAQEQTEINIIQDYLPQLLKCKKSQQP